MIRNADIVRLPAASPEAEAADTAPAPVAVTVALAPPANDPRGGVSRRPFAARPGLGLGIRVLPLEGFVWGQQGAMHRPRVRGDAVLLLVERGAIRIELPARRLSFGAGTLVYLPAGTAFSALPSADVAGRALLLPARTVGMVAVALPRALVAGRIAATDLAALGGHVAAIDRHSRSDDSRDVQASLMRLGLIAVALDEMNPDDGQRHNATPHLPQEPRELVGAFMELAGRELGRGRTVSDLAQAVGTTTAALDWACRLVRGRSALELTYDLRLERAIARLRGSDLPTAEIAHELGFTGIGHMARCFMAATGRPPEDFRSGAVGALTGDDI